MDEPPLAPTPASPAVVWRRKLEQVLLVVLVAAAARVAFIALTPGLASVDLKLNWTTVAEVLARRQNPYNTTPFLNWPPLWMQFIYALGRFSELTSTDWFLTVRSFTALLDLLGLTAATWLLASPDRRTTHTLLWGWALNPSAILIACQHANFDGLVVLFCLLAVACLVRRLATRDVVDWLLGCTFVGLGVLAKTVPIVLGALLIGTARPFVTRAKLLGAFATLGPVALGISIIYVLGPEAVTARVLNYRSFSGFYGISGLLHALHAQPLAELWGKAFPLLLLGACAWIARLGWSGRLDRGGLIMAAGWLLLLVPTLGPGYGPQYAAWSLPFLALALSTSEGVTRLVLTGQLVITACTQIVEYGLLPSHGALWFRFASGPSLQTWANRAYTQEGSTFLRLPLFFVSVLCLCALASQLKKEAAT